MALVSSNFEQQGTVSWDSVGAQTVSFTYNFLSRCAEAGVDVRSIAVGQLIAQDFPLSTAGQRNVEKAIDSLPMHRGYGGAMWFGFGINTFARTLSKTNEGCSLLALCAALSESFHEEYAAEVMHNLVSLKKFGTQMTPSIKQWLMIVRACAGAFATTKFSRLVEGIMRLHSANAQTPSGSFDRPPAPRDFADVLFAIGSVARGRLSSIRIAGGAGAAWLAAVSEWLFDLRVVVQVGEQLGLEFQTVYHSKNPDEDAQVQVQLTNYYSHGSVELDMIKTVSTSVILHRGTADGLPPFLVIGEPHASPMSTRVSWHNSLSVVFGQDFKTLFHQKASVGVLLGCAAREIQLFACDSEALSKLSEDSDRILVPSHSEQGLIETLLSTLPELSFLAENALIASRLNRPEARKGYLKHVRALRRLCCCFNCIAFGSADGGTSDLSASHSCFLDIVFAILRLGFQLSEIIIAEDLLPTKRGIESVYRQERQITRETIRKHGMSDQPGRDNAELEMVRLQASISEMCRWRGPTRHLSLFTDLPTRFDPNPHDGMWAAVSGGICVYSQLLQNFSLEPSCIGKFRIVPGRIEKDDKDFDCILDKVPSWESSSMDSKVVDTDRHLDAKVQLDLVLREASDQLEAHYLLQTISVPRLIRTARFTLREAITLGAHGNSLIPCSGNPSVCRDDHLLNALELSDSLENSFSIFARFQSQTITFLFGGTDRYLSQATAMLGYRATSVSRIVSHDECIYCCLRMISDLAKSPSDGSRSSSMEGDRRSYILVVRGQKSDDWLLRPWQELRKGYESLPKVQTNS